MSAWWFGIAREAGTYVLDLLLQLIVLLCGLLGFAAGLLGVELRSVSMKPPIPGSRSVCAARQDG